MLVVHKNTVFCPHKQRRASSDNELFLFWVKVLFIMVWVQKYENNKHLGKVP